MSAVISQPQTPALLAMPDGAHRDVPANVYHVRWPGLVSKSALDLVHRSPAHYKAWVDGVLRNEETAALAFGVAFHVALLEPERFANYYVVMPRFDEYRDKAGRLSTKEGKAKLAEWRMANAGKHEIEAEDLETIRAMVASVRSHPLAGKMIRDGVPELTLKWTDEETGLTCKARGDYYVERHRMAVDVKSTDDASYEAFRKSVAKYGYHRQDALYRAGFAAVGKPVDHFILVSVEKTAPYAVGLFQLDEEGVSRGYDSVRHDMSTLARCVKTNEWPAYIETIQTLQLPPWAA